MSAELQTSNKTEIQNNSTLDMDEGRYIYCIIATDQEEIKITSPAIGDQGKGVYPVRSNPVKRDADTPLERTSNRMYSISCQDIAAIVSPSPITRYSISRENTIAHQKVLEELMNDYTVLPVRFGTVAGGKGGVSASERIRERVLKARHKELKTLLTKMDDKIELGLKALWSDMKVIFEEIVEENKDIKVLKEKITSKNPLHTYGDRITLGEKVKGALERKKTKEEEEILDVLKKSYVDMRRNKIFGDNMLTNSAFLVEKPKMEEFDKLVDKLSTNYNGRVKFKYVGPVPPCNFVELVIVLEEER